MKGNITITMLYYESPEMLRLQLSYWRKYSKEVADRVRMVLVDDGSPKFPAGDVLASESLPAFPVRLYRATENIIYNQAGAFNLAFTKIEDGWALMSDMDHVITSKNMEKLLATKVDPDNVYRFGRVRMKNMVEGEVIHRHLDSILLTKDMFWRAKGFDEDYRGYWNGVSEPFRKSLKRNAKEIIELTDIKLLNFPVEVVPDSGNTVFGKAGSEYDIHTNSKMVTKRRLACRDYQPKNYLRFKWEQVM